MTHATLTLMRHAKSSWNNQRLSDHDRVLNDRGNRDAPDMAQRLLERNSVPDLILCSSAIRTRETTAHLLRVFGSAAPQVQYEKLLYLASLDTMLSAIASAPDWVKHLMIVAHNPGTEELSAFLQTTADDTMPTAAIRQFECDGPESLAKSLGALKDLYLQGTQPIGIRLTYSDYPKNR